MRIEHRSLEPLAVAALAAVLLTAGGCGNSDPDSTGKGGQVGSMGGSSPGSGGTTGSGGSTQPGSGGAALGGATSAGGATGSGGATASGGALTLGGRAGGGTANQGGASAGAAGALSAGGGAPSSGGRSSGGSANGGASSGGSAPAGGSTCTASKSVSANVSGSGPHKVTVETNSDAGIKEGTIYRPTDLGGTEKYPILVWGNGACSLNGLSNTASMGEIASHGYFVVADGTPNGGGGRNQTSDWISMGKPLVAYISWVIAENEKPCSAYYHSIDTTKVASNGFSCGGLMSEGAAVDPRITAWGFTSSGLTGADQNYYKKVHAPTLVILGGTSDIAYQNGERDFDNIGPLGIPIMLFSKNIGHGGDLGAARGGDFTKIHLAWLNWQLKGDEGATGKGILVGSSCSYCKDSAWEVKSKNIQ